MSHGRKNSVRDKGIGKERIYLKRNTLHGQECGPSQKASVHAEPLQSCPILCNAIACQALLSMGIIQARILEWVAVPSSRGLPNPVMEPRSPALQEDSLPSEPPGKPENEQIFIPIFKTEIEAKE